MRSPLGYSLALLPLRHALSRILPLVLPACMVDAPIVEGSDDRLGEGLGAWCESMCERAASCGAADDPETCPDDCAEYFDETFIGKNDVCSEAALRVMDCIDAQTCEGNVGAACHLDDEADSCAISRGEVVCRSLDVGVGGNGGAGGSAGYAGMAGVICELGISNCSDRRSYRLVCSGSDEQCHCLVDDAVETTVELEALECPAPEDAIARCGWPIATVRDDSENTGSVCRTYESANAGAGSSSCSFSFGGCANDLVYSLDCSGTPGAAQCSCLVDGVAIGRYASPADICPYVTSNSDSGVLAIYDACGFSISVI